MVVDVDLHLAAGRERAIDHDLAVQGARLAGDEILTAVRFSPTSGPQRYYRVGPRNAVCWATASVKRLVSDLPPDDEIPGAPGPTTALALLEAYLRWVRQMLATRSNLDVARTWALVKAFVDTGNVEVIFMDYGLQQQLYEFAKERGVGDDELDELFQYPRGRGRSHGMIRHWRSHQHHFHVRFRS